jgi:EAL domain-containing protein (putative c-di-GMP-specific phosphodiesterase class I)
MFVKDIADSREDRAIIEAVTKLGHALGIMITAEGIETLQQLERIREMGCDEAQGFLLCKRSRPRSGPLTWKRFAITSG